MLGCCPHMPNERAVEVSFAPNKRDLFRSGLLVWRRHFRWQYRIAIGVSSLLALFVLLMNLVAEPGERSMLYGLDVVFIVPFVVYFFPHIILDAVIRTMFRDNPPLAQPSRYVFSASGVVVESSTGRSDLNWSIYQRVWETPDYFLLYTGQRTAGALPKRYFSSEEDIRAFRERLRSSVSGRVELQS
jgi:hypothetical protein